MDSEGSSVEPEGVILMSSAVRTCPMWHRTLDTHYSAEGDIPASLLIIYVTLGLTLHF